MLTAVVQMWLSGTEDHLQQKCQIQDYQNKDWLSEAVET